MKTQMVNIDWGNSEREAGRSKPEGEKQEIRRESSRRNRLKRKKRTE